MTTKFVTRWFPASVKPVRAGAYEMRTRKPSPPRFAWWNGSEWSVPHLSPAGAMGCAGFETPFQSREWRGIKPSQLIAYEHGYADLPVVEQEASKE